MGAANGFVTVSPDAQYGDTYSNLGAGLNYAQKFTCGGTGTQNISEIGIYIGATSGYTTTFHLGIFEDDAANICPATLVANSDSGALTHNSTTQTKKYTTYGTKPQVTGGTDYWLAFQPADAYDYVSRFVATKVGLSKQGTYPTWPTDTEWHTHTDVTNRDYSLYAVYVAGGFSESIAGILSQSGAIGRKYMGDRLLTAEF